MNEKNVPAVDVPEITLEPPYQMMKAIPSPAKNSMMGEDKDLAVPDLPRSAHHPVPEKLLLPESEIRSPDRDVGLLLDKRAPVQKKIQAFPGGQLALVVLGLDSLLASAGEHLSLLLVKPVYRILVPHGSPPVFKKYFPWCLGNRQRVESIRL